MAPQVFFQPLSSCLTQLMKSLNSVNSNTTGAVSWINNTQNMSSHRHHISQHLALGLPSFRTVRKKFLLRITTQFMTFFYSSLNRLRQCPVFTQGPPIVTFFKSILLGKKAFPSLANTSSYPLSKCLPSF